MKVVITGHRSGIGLALANKLIDNGHEVIGFDIVDGKDVTQPDVIKEIKAAALSADAFVNNCFFGQYKVLIEVAMLLKGHNKIIVNLGSVMTYLHDESPKDTEQAIDYYNQKLKLDTLIKKLNRSGQVSIMNVRVSRVDTPSIHGIDDIEKLKPETVANIIFDNMMLWNYVKVLDIVLAKNV